VFWQKVFEIQRHDAEKCLLFGIFWLLILSVLMNLLGEGTTTARGSAGAVPLGSRRALAREFHGPEWNFV
jgi:hypothetical protein